jgi:hypothetical protein
MGNTLVIPAFERVKQEDENFKSTGLPREILSQKENNNTMN